MLEMYVSATQCFCVLPQKLISSEVELTFVVIQVLWWRHSLAMSSLATKSASQRYNAMSTLLLSVWNGLQHT